MHAQINTIEKFTPGDVESVFAVTGLCLSTKSQGKSRLFAELPAHTLHNRRSLPNVAPSARQRHNDKDIHIGLSVGEPRA